MTLTFTISGDVASKKNSQRGVIRGGRYYRIPSAKHEEWHTRAAIEIKAQLRSLSRENYAKLGIPISKCAITMRFWSSTNRRADIDNASSSCLDLLCDVGVLKDDSWHVVPELHLFYEGKDPNARVEITIQTL